MAWACRATSHTRTNVEPDLCRHPTSLGCNELRPRNQWSLGNALYIYTYTCVDNGVNPWRAGTELSRFNRVNIMVVDALATCVARISSSTILIMLNRQVHYNDGIMGAIASQITSLTTVYSIVYSDADQRKHQSSASLAFVRGIHRGPVNSLHKWPVTRKMFPFDDVILSCLKRERIPTTRVMSVWRII